jgi:hypothetical protein
MTVEAQELAERARTGGFIPLDRTPRTPDGRRAVMVRDISRATYLQLCGHAVEGTFVSIRGPKDKARPVVFRFSPDAQAALDQFNEEWNYLSALADRTKQASGALAGNPAHDSAEPQ